MCAKSSTEIVVRHGEILTGERLFKMGIWACYNCSAINPLENDRCKSCHEDRFFVVYREEEERQKLTKPDIVVEQNRIDFAATIDDVKWKGYSNYRSEYLP